tara:strand:- start:410 stop:1645 length:1236 start_codon:yes stop_codon:yes gene_type:complete
MIKWQEVKLRDITTKIGDGLHGTPSYDELGKYYFINGNNFSNGKIVIKKDTDKVSEDEFKKIKRDLTDKTILVSINGTLGNVALYNNETVGLGKSACYINVNKTVSRDFIRYCIDNPYFRRYADLYSTGSTIKNLSLKAVRDFKINLPPFSTQQKIVKILSKYDDLFENNLKRIKLLEESGRLTYEEWFLRFRVDGKKLEINPTSGLPFKWEKKSITEFDAFKQDKQKSKEFKGEKKYYATADVSETVITADGETINWDNKPSRAQIKPNNNTVWFARMSDTYKVLCFNNKNINLQENSIISSGFAGFKAKNDLCLPFLYFTINSKFFHELKNLYATGATQVSLNNDSMSFIKIIEPNADLVEEFGSRTLPFIEEISILRSKNQLLKEARDILLPRLMTATINTDKIDITV